MLHGGKTRKSLLLIGGNGFLGRSIVNRALDYSFNVTIISRSKINTESFRLHCECIEADILDKRILRPILLSKKFNYVINASGDIDHSEYFGAGKKVFDTHFIGLKNIITVLTGLI